MKDKKIDKYLINIISNEGEPEDEFIVGIDFYYDDVTYSGYQIVDRSTVKILWDELQKDRQVYTPNMPGDWYEEFDISLLEDAFSIHSDSPDDINSMRNLFGDSVGNTDLLNMVLDEVSGSDEYEEDDENSRVIDVEAAKEILNDNASSTYEAIEITATEITDEAIELLSKHEGDLWLDGLKELSDAAAESLSNHKGDLWLDALAELSDAVAKSLSKHQGKIHFNSLTKLSDVAAESYQIIKGDYIYLYGLKELSDAAAESLSKYQGNLYLNGLTVLSDHAAESLSKQKRWLTLDGLYELSDAAAESLSKYECEYGSDYFFSGLTELSDAVAESLSNCSRYHLSLSGVNARGLNELSDAAVESISKYTGSLELNGLTELLADDAESLSKHKGDLSLIGLDELLSDSAAEALSNHKGNITFEGLYGISDSAAEALSKYQGKINGMDPKEWIESLQENDEE